MWKENINNQNQPPHATDFLFNCLNHTILHSIISLHLLASPLTFHAFNTSTFNILQQKTHLSLIIIIIIIIIGI